MSQLNSNKTGHAPRFDEEPGLLRLIAFCFIGQLHLLTFALADAQGMGFWDFQNADQNARDNRLYATDHRDAEIAQLGTLRLAHYLGEPAGWVSEIVVNQAFMPTAFVLGSLK